MPLNADEDLVVLHVHAGEITDAGSWVYAWLRGTGDRRAVYVGATGLQPGTRVWLHLHDPDPDIGRVAALYPAALHEPLEVVAVRAPEGVPRSEAKALAIARLAEAGFLSEHYAGDPPLTDLPAVASAAASQVERLVAHVGLAQAIDSSVELLRAHRPYHESDHVLNIAYNTLCGGTRLDDIEARRSDRVFCDALGVATLPDPTTAGDFCLSLIHI